MSVTNRHDATDTNVKTLFGFRLGYESRAIADTDVQVLGETSPPVQLVTTSGTGPAVLRLPLAAKDGTIFIVTNVLASTQALTVTDDAGSPVTINAIPTDAWVVCMKVGDAYVPIMEGVLTLA